MRTVLALCLAAFPLTVSAATCTWNASSGNWSVPSNWTGCADGGGPSTRSPGPGDIAVLAGGTATLDVSPVVSEFELGAGGVLSLTGFSQTLEVIDALRLAGGHAVNVLGVNQLTLKLDAGGTGVLTAPTTLENAVFLENSGALALGSANGTALKLLVASQLRNMPGGSITMAGGASRLDLVTSAQLVNNEGATLTISGNARIGQPDSGNATTYVINKGTMIVNGPGTLDMPMGTNAQFRQLGELTVHNATVVCDLTASDACRYDDVGDESGTSSITRLDNATLDLGGSGILMPVSPGSTLAGTGIVDADVRLRGTLAPGAPSGAPFGTLVITGALEIGPAGTIALDLGGTASGSYDRVQVAGEASAGYDTNFGGNGVLLLHLVGGYAPALGEALPVMTYASVASGASFHRVDANYALDFVARFDPTALNVFPGPRITIENVSVVEGSSGTTPMRFEARLSQPFSQLISVELRPHSGTAVDGPAPNGDYLFPGEFTFTFAPGETLVTQTYPINGDTVVEADESFTVELQRNKLVNASVGNGIPGSLLAIGTIITDELPAGTRFVLVGKDVSENKIRRYTTTGTFIDAWDDGMPDAAGYIITGMCFAPNGDVLATRFAFPNAILFSHQGGRLNTSFGGNVYMHTHESCVFDPMGNVYIGVAGASGAPDTDVPVRKFNRYGELLDSYVLPTGTRGTDWIDLGADHCTLYYTSEDTAVRRYNVCTRTPLPDLIDDLTGPYCYAIRLRPNREVMVACQDAVHRVSPDGVNLHTYTRESIGETDPAGLFAMNLDPDATSFWTAGLLSGNVYHVDIASGAQLGSFNSGPGGVSGLAVYDELSHEIVFADGFDPVEGSAFGSSKRGPRPECKREFWPEVREMPWYVPRWISVVVRDDGECER